MGTATGRYSCSDPPLQALDRRVRRAIEAAPGYVLLEADYSQFELRVLAHFSQDAALLHAFHNNIDLHIRTAARVLGIAETAVTDQQRQLGKTLNFGIVYGQTAYGLADELGVSMQRAQALLDRGFWNVIARVTAGRQFWERPLFAPGLQLYISM
jgi:DNA polymerase-1